MATCDAAEWQVCSDELEAAYTLDPAGEEFDVHAMRFKAKNFAVNREHNELKPGGPYRE